MAVKRICDNSEKLIKLLDKQAELLFDEIEDAHLEANEANAVEKFTYGFKLAMLLTIEVLTGIEDLLARE